MIMAVSSYFLTSGQMNECVSVCIEGLHNGNSFRCMPEQTEIWMYDRMNI